MTVSSSDADVEQVINDLAGRLREDAGFRFMLRGKNKFDLTMYFDNGTLSRDGDYSLHRHPIPRRRKRQQQWQSDD